MGKIRMPILTVFLLSILSGCMVKEPVEQYNIAQGSHRAVAPFPRDFEPWWMQRYQAILDRVSKGNVDMIMIGDSITQGWEGAGKSVWDKYYKWIYYLDVNSYFLDEKGGIPEDLMPDKLNANENGYPIWSQLMEPTIEKLMK
jgi:lysophospholipase L1-like esterase